MTIMTILTSYTAATYKAQIRSDLARGFTPIYHATCTMGDLQAARAVVTRHFGPAAADSVLEIKDAAEIYARVGGFFQDAKRKQVFRVWRFDPRAKRRSHTV